jgi:prepilin-type N-terminal cleavage/methylation domain-containing protein
MSDNRRVAKMWLANLFIIEIQTPSNFIMNAQRRYQSRNARAQSPSVTGSPRATGFTLVELLVVIVIIGILMSIAVPAIFSAVSTAKSTAMKMELNSLEMAVQKYQEKYGDYPPDFADWAVVERHYRKIFPRISGDLILLKSLLTDTNGYNPTIIDRGEVLPWVLGGYSSDPLRPFTGAGGPLELVGMTGSADDIPVYQINTSKENSLFDFAPGQLDLTIPVKNSPINILNYHVSSDGDLFLSYAASTKTETPFVYFDSRTYEYRNPSTTSKGFNGFWRPASGPVRPYISDIVQTDQTWQFMKPDSFQIIAPGIDGNFGWLSKQNGTTGANDNDTSSAVYFQYPTGKAGQVIDNNGVRTRVLRSDVSRYQEPVSANQIDNFQQDNLTNFADGKLIDELKE